MRVYTCGILPGRRASWSRRFGRCRTRMLRNTSGSRIAVCWTLTHIVWADWLWFTRVVGPMEKPGQSREVLETVWPELLDSWVGWAEGASDDEVNRIVEYKSILDGQIART